MLRILRSRAATILGIALFIGLGLWAFWLEPASLRLQPYRIELGSWPAPLSGLRVAALGDLHVGSPYNGPERLAKLVAKVNQAKPDLILLLGDYVIQGLVGGHFVPPERIAEQLGRLRAPLGVIAILGNHDLWLSGKRVGAAFRAHGIRVLENHAIAMGSGATRFWIAGVNDAFVGDPNIAQALGDVKDGAPVIVITHSPDIFPDVPARVSLTLAAHTHGGQVYLPIVGRPVVPSRYGQRYAIGHVVEGGRHLFVTPGVGTSIFPVRFRVPPEVSLLELASPATDLASRPAPPRPE